MAHTLGASDVDAVLDESSFNFGMLHRENDSPSPFAAAPVDSYEGKTIFGKDVCNTITACLSRQLGTTQDATCVFTKEAHPRNATEGQGWRETDIAKTLNTFCTGETRAEELIVGYDNHPNDSRVTEASGAFACLPSNMGTGGNNTPLVQEVRQTVLSKTGRPTEAGGCPNFKETGVANTLNLWDLGESRANELVVVDTPVISLGGDKIVNSNDLMYTQTAKGIHGVAYGINCQASLMHPFSEEVSQVISVAHQSGVVRDECVPIDMRNATRDADKKDDVNRQGLGVGDDAPSQTVTANPCEACWRVTVRRLLPVETERLMGFPDNWTRIPWRGKPAEQCPGGPRYKACGNSFCVNCMEWIGERIEKVERELQEEGR